VNCPIKPSPLPRQRFAGLIIGRASYGCALDLDEARDLVIDVTIPLQSLVHKSQLYISGQQTKVDDSLRDHMHFR
jgi:hypothetical protein